PTTKGRTAEETIALSAQTTRRTTRHAISPRPAAEVGLAFLRTLTILRRRPDPGDDGGSPMRVPLTTVAALDQIAVADPCPVSWDERRGNERVRFCERSQKTVYTLSEMTAAAAAALVEASQDRLCIQLFRRRDGTLVTSDSTTGWRWNLFKRLRRRMAWATSLFALVFLSGCPMGGGNMRGAGGNIAPRPPIPAKDPGVGTSTAGNDPPSAPK